MNIFVVDSCELGLSSLTELVLEVPGVFLIGTARSCGSAIENMLDLESRRSHPDVVILDAELEDGCSYGLMKFIKRYFPETQIIMLYRDASALFPELMSTMLANYFFDKHLEIHNLEETLRSLRVRTESDQALVPGTDSYPGASATGSAAPGPIA